MVLILHWFVRILGSLACGQTKKSKMRSEKRHTFYFIFLNEAGYCITWKHLQRNSRRSLEAKRLWDHCTKTRIFPCEACTWADTWELAKVPGFWRKRRQTKTHFKAVRTLSCHMRKHSLLFCTSFVLFQCYYSEFWLKYATYVDKALGATPARDVLSRATSHLRKRWFVVIAIFYKL